MSIREPRSRRRVYEESRYGYCMGTLGGVAIEFVKSAYKNRNLKVGLEAARRIGPQVAGFSFVISSTFYTVEHVLESVRQKDDLFNQIIAGSASIGLVNARDGFIPATRFAALCGPFIGLVLGDKIIGTSITKLNDFLDQY